MYALVEIKGKQYKAEKGKTLIVDLYRDANEGDVLEFPVLMTSNLAGEVVVGAPHVSGAVVKTKVIGEVKAKKIRVFKYKKRKGYRRTIGHRQHHTTLLVEEVKA